MRSSVIITNYNYGQYITECVESVLAQTQAADQILIVDDGSTDDSWNIISRLAAQYPLITAYCQENQGHFAALHRGLSMAEGDYVFLLDADDRYLPAHLESTLSLFEAKPKTDLVFCAYNNIGEKAGEVHPRSHSGDLGESTLATSYGNYWASGQTSLLAIRRSLLKRLLPWPSHWSSYGIHSAEAAVVLGASILGARQYYLDEVHVEYRWHESNVTRQHQHPETAYRMMRLNHLIGEHYRQLIGLPAHFLREALAEFKTWERPTRKEWRCYRSLIWQSPLPFFRKCEHLLRAYRHYKRNREA